MQTTSAPKPLFADLPPTPGGHYSLVFYAAVLHLLSQVIPTYGSDEAAFDQFPFLAHYYNELAGHGLEGLTLEEASARWHDELRAWEETVSGHLPLRAVRESAGLDDVALTLLVTTGLIEEDARFGLLFETLQGAPSQRRPTLGLLTAWWQDSLSPGEARTTIRRLHELGLIQVVNPEAPRPEWALQVSGPLWDALRGENYEVLAPGLRYQPPDRLARSEELIVLNALRESLAAMPALLAGGDVGAVVVRGPRHNGRRTVLGTLARALGRGLLEITGLKGADDEHWRIIGPLATALHALPAVVLDLGPGESADLPSLLGYDGPLGVALGLSGGVRGPGLARALTLTLDMPTPEARQQHWQQALGPHAVDGLETIVERFRLTGGNIRRAAGLAQAYAALADRAAVTPADVQAASRALNRQALDTLAERVETAGDWSQLAVSPETAAELGALESRCRHRERLGTAVGPALSAGLTAGVRALFSGPSGTGKTLAACALAAALQMDLYRLDLSSVVNKYIGETEKNLSQLFARAEELDVILLLDEGDALLTGRTSVQTSNDRYANLETNYLLQRLESFEGILIVTTNAAERIDSAFQRRMDVVVTFRAPEASERWAIWQLHLPPAHAIHYTLLEEVARRCELRGGQIRNAVLHASLLALDDGRVVTSAHLEAAVQREYRKAGTVCPLRRPAANGR